LQPKETAPPTVTESEPWQFTIAVPGWLSSMDGTIGVRGVNANIDVPVTEILQHFDAILAGRVEAQKGPFGIFGEVIYIGLSDGAQINGLINNIHETVDTTYVDGALSWRLVNQPRWSLDFAAGTHYTTVYEQLELHSDPILIQQTSEQFVTNISDDLEARLNNDISNKDFLATVGSMIESDIVAQIANQLSRILDAKLGQTIARQDDWFDPYLGLRGRYNFNKTFYTAVRGEIGGFGVGADLMWEVEAMLGVNLTRNIFTEVGYRA